MQYLLLIYSNETEASKRTPEQEAALIADYRTYTDALKAEGIMLAGEALETIDSATSVRVRGGQVLHTDGPFAETKEQLGGFFLLECENLDQAIDAAARCPTSKHGTLEVRPIFDWSKHYA